MAASEPPRLTIVQPGAGPTGVLGSIGVGFQPWGEETGGALSIVEHPFPVGALVGAHLHTREDEYTIVTEGEIGFRSGEREVVLGSGGYITIPRGEMRAMWNAGTVPGSPRLTPTHGSIPVYYGKRWQIETFADSARIQHGEPGDGSVPLN